MVWVKVDDQFPEHAKVLEAGRHLGAHGAGRVVTVWMVAMCFSNRTLTDGLVPVSVIKTWTIYDRKPLDVADVMALAMPDGSPGLFVPAGHAYQIHDYAHYQPSRQQVKTKRAADRDRKRAAREAQRIARESARRPRGQVADSAGIPMYPIPIPDLSQKDHGAARRPPQPVEAQAVLKALIWLEVKAGIAAGETHWSDLLERVKTAAARAGIEYGSDESLQFLSDEFGLAYGRMVTAGAGAAN